MSTMGLETWNSLMVEFYVWTLCPALPSFHPSHGWVPRLLQVSQGLALWPCLIQARSPSINLVGTYSAEHAEDA